MAQLTHEFLLKEVAGALYTRRRLLDQTTKIESECTTLDKLNAEKKTTGGSRTAGAGAGRPVAPSKHAGGSPASPRKLSGSSFSGIAATAAGKAGPSPSKSNKHSPSRGSNNNSSGSKMEASNTASSKEKSEADNFDLRLQSIITSALIGDDSVLSDTKDSKIAKNVKDTLLGHIGLHGGTRVPFLEMMDPGLQRKHQSGPPPADSKGDVVIKREKESPKGRDSVNQISLPVKIPLKDVGRKTAAGPVPVLTLNSAQGGKTGPHGPGPGQHPVHGHHLAAGGGGGGARPGSPQNLREAYSPISRPSSSSSTASADSVKGLAHGATRRSTSPRTPHSASAANTFNIDCIVSEAQRSAAAAAAAAAAATGGRFIPPLPHAHAYKDSFVGQLSPGAHAHKTSGTHHLGYAMYPPHFPPAGMLGLLPPMSAPPTDKDPATHLHPGAKQLLMNSGSPYGLPPPPPTSQHSQAFYGYPGTLNGLPKDSPLLLDKPKKVRRKRSSSSSGSGAKLGPSDAKRLAEGKTAPGGVEPPQAEVASMMSTASQPLPIQSLPDAENKSGGSPLLRPGSASHRMDLHSSKFFILLAV